MKLTKSFYEMNGPHLKNKSNSNIISENLNNYYYFLCELKKIKNCRFLTCYAAYKENKLESKTIVLRHDVDGDIVASLRNAKIENKLVFSLHIIFYILLLTMEILSNTTENIFFLEIII